MTLCQTITRDFESEMTNTRKLLERIPLDGDQRDFKPHPKSMPLSRLATHVAELPGWQKMALEAEIFDLKADFTPRVASSSAELLEIFDKSVADATSAFATATDEDLTKSWTFSFAGNPVFTSPRPDVIRSFINHLIHHRAQLSVYLRLLDIPVPGMYGPSADDGWPPK